MKNANKDILTYFVKLIFNHINMGLVLTGKITAFDFVMRKNQGFRKHKSEREKPPPPPPPGSSPISRTEAPPTALATLSC